MVGFILALFITGLTTILIPLFIAFWSGPEASAGKRAGFKPLLSKSLKERRGKL